MEQYISKAAIVAEIEKLQLCTMDEHMNFYSAEAQGEYNALSKLESFLDTLEVKEIHEDIDVDLNPFFKELGVEPDSRIAYTFKEAFYKGIDRYLNEKENKL